MIGRANRFLIVFDHNDGIPEIAQPSQRCQQPRVIALMQADARFVQNIENAGQTGADLRGEPNALRFAAGKRAAFAIEREIIESDFEQKLQARINFAHDIGDDVRCCSVKLQPPDVFCRCCRSSVR